MVCGRMALGVLLPVGRIAKLRTPRCQVPNSFYPIKIPTMGIDQDLNDVARNTNDTNKLRQLVAKGANLRSTNGAPWNHTPLHQACYHGRLEQARTLLELGAGMNIENMPSNDCGRGGNGKPIDLARGGGHQAIVALLEGAAPQATPNPNAPESFTFTGFVGYNARFNGLYMWNQGGEMQSEKPVYSHITQEGVGAGHDWCRLWFHSGFWRIGHFSVSLSVELS